MERKGSDNRSGPTEMRHARSFLVDTLERPDKGTERLPYLVSLLESDQRSVRFTAAMTCCLIAIEQEDEQINKYLIRRLSHRLDNDEVSLELTTALDYLSSLYSEQVGEILEEIDAEHDGLPLPEVGSFTREHYYSREYSRDDVGRTRIPDGNEDDPRQTYSDDEIDEEVDIRDGKSEGTTAGAEAEQTNTAGGGPAWDAEFEEDPNEMLRRTTEVSTIAVKSRFDDLHIRGEHRRGRYADTYGALVGDSRQQQAVALRLFHRPGRTDSRQVFEDELETQIERWAALQAHPHVVKLLDWGIDPQPWIVTGFVSESLSDRGVVDTITGLDIGRKLASATALLHNNDIVHGGLDPGVVVYPGEPFVDTDSRDPMLDNVGLLNVFRHHFPPSRCLDPRYAAPEYYNDQFGRIDHATDIYQLGAVCYRLFTGRPPHTGDFDRIRDAVLESIPPAPSTIVDVPEQLDDIIMKAMAKEKLRRYETVEHFQQELETMAENHGYI